MLNSVYYPKLAEHLGARRMFEFSYRIITGRKCLKTCMLTSSSAGILQRTPNIRQVSAVSEIGLILGTFGVFHKRFPRATHTSKTRDAIYQRAYEQLHQVVKPYPHQHENCGISRAGSTRRLDNVPQYFQRFSDEQRQTVHLEVLRCTVHIFGHQKSDSDGLSPPVQWASRMV